MRDLNAAEALTSHSGRPPRLSLQTTGNHHSIELQSYSRASIGSLEAVGLEKAGVAAKRSVQ